MKRIIILENAKTRFRLYYQELQDGDEKVDVAQGMEGTE
jgi:hypothetical protein